MSVFRKFPWLISRLIANERIYLQKYDVPLITALRLNAKGFFSFAAVFYDLDRIELYLSERQRHQTVKINGSSGDLLRNKLAFNHLLCQRFPENLAEVYAVIRGGRVLIGNGEKTSLSTVIKQEGNIVCKPMAGGRGQGIYLIREKNNSYQLNGKPVVEADIDEIGRDLDSYLVVEEVKQHDYSSRIFSNSLNTMRIVTMVNPSTGKPFIGIAVHRFGTSGSAPADNWSAGGLAAQIDTNTGKLGEVALVDGGSEVIWREQHPMTGEEIQGKIIPHWDAVKEFVLRVASEHSHLWDYVGWDIALREDGTPVIIEGNRATDVGPLQIHEPLLANEDRRRFYEYHGII